MVFSPEGDSLLVPTVEGCNDLISFGCAPDLVHKVPADATLADVTQETSIYVLRVRSADQNRFALAFRTHHMKTQTGRKKKIESFVAMLQRGETIYPQRQWSI